MKRLLASALLIILLAGASLVALGLEFPLVIEGDHELAAVDGIRGNGTPDDPYVLEGLSATAGSATPFLALRYIDAHLIIRDSSFSNAIGAAIALKTCRNISIYACVFSDNGIAIDYDPGCMDISILLNSFLRNAKDLAATTYFVQLNDGYVGNYWDKYTGEDSTGDGIGEEPMILTDWQTPLVDERPLIYPYAGDRSMDPEGVRLEAQYDAGESFLQEMYVVAHVASDSGVTTTDVKFPLANMITVEMSVGAPDRLGMQRAIGNVVHESQWVGVSTENPEEHSIVDEQLEYIGYPFAMGTAGPLQTSEIAQLFRPEDPILLFPVRPIQPGHSWSFDYSEVYADYYSDFWESHADAAYLFKSIDEYKGIPCAVVEWTFNMGFGIEETPTSMNWTSMLNSMQWEGTHWIALETGQMLRSVSSMRILQQIQTDEEMVSDYHVSALLVVERLLEP